MTSHRSPVTRTSVTRVPRRGGKKNEKPRHRVWIPRPRKRRKRREEGGDVDETFRGGGRVTRPRRIEIKDIFAVPASSQFPRPLCRRCIARPPAVSLILSEPYLVDEKVGPGRGSRRILRLPTLRFNRSCRSMRIGRSGLAPLFVPANAKRSLQPMKHSKRFGSNDNFL